MSATRKYLCSSVVCKGTFRPEGETSLCRDLRIIRERVRSGMANAKGARIGRAQATVDDIPAVFLRHYPAYKKKQLNVSELARVCDLSGTTVYKYIDLLEG